MLQVVMGFNCNIEFPPLFEKALRSIAILNLDIIPSLGLQCRFSEFDYIHSMVSITVGPLVLGMLLVFAYMVTVLTNTKSDKELELRINKYVIPERLMEYFSSRERQSLKRTFAAFDVRDNGEIDCEELQAAIEKFNPEESKEHVEAKVAAMVAEANIDGDTTISFQEFLFVLVRARKKGSTSQFSMLVDKVEADANHGAGQHLFYALLLLSYLVLVSTSTALFHFFKVRSF